MTRRRTTPEATAAGGRRRGRPLGFDRNDATSRLTAAFWRYGWAGSSTPVLEEATGLSRSSLANSFGTKTEMLTAALAHYNDLIADHLVADLDRTTADPGGALHGFFDALAALKADDPGRYGCLVVNTIVELPERDPAVEQQTRRYERILLAGFTSALGRTGNAEDQDVEHRANVLLALALAVNLHARNRDAAAVAATTASAHALIDSWT